jgi:site-specific DNA-methyltransferase (adenine-specific)
MTAPFFADDIVTLYLGKAEHVLPTLADASVDAVCTDPPYELGFMGRAWDAAGVAFDPATWAACLRVLKPGGHLLAFGGTRTWHRMVCAVEDAGFEIRDSIHWIAAQGFPKSLDVAKAIDKAGGSSPQQQAAVLRQARERAGMSRHDVAAAIGCTVTSVCDWEEGRARARGCDVEYLVPSPEYRRKLADLLGYTQDERVVVGVGGGSRGLYKTGHRGVQYGPGATDAARRWEGWGTALKPAHEPIVVARKPLAGTVAGNVLTHGTGALNIDACRTATSPADAEAMKRANTPGSGRMRAGGSPIGTFVRSTPTGAMDTTRGRWPTNLVFTHSDCDHECAPDCPVGELDRQSGVRTSGSRRAGDFELMGYMGADVAPMPAIEGNSGGASRFFPVFRYEAKASPGERPRVDGVAHETVKPLDLMRWLVRLVTPPGGTVLDPFLGSGTTAEACVIEGFRCVGIERDDRYIPLIKARLSKPLQPTLGFEEEGIA